MHQLGLVFGVHPLIRSKDRETFVENVAAAHGPGGGHLGSAVWKAMTLLEACRILTSADFREPVESMRIICASEFAVSGTAIFTPPEHRPSVDPAVR